MQRGPHAACGTHRGVGGWRTGISRAKWPSKALPLPACAAAVAASNNAASTALQAPSWAARQARACPAIAGVGLRPRRARESGPLRRSFGQGSVTALPALPAREWGKWPHTATQKHDGAAGNVGRGRAEQRTPQAPFQSAPSQQPPPLAAHEGTHGDGTRPMVCPPPTCPSPPARPAPIRGASSSAPAPVSLLLLRFSPLACSRTFEFSCCGLAGWLATLSQPSMPAACV